jgi:hypothetical protein
MAARRLLIILVLLLAASVAAAALAPNRTSRLGDSDSGETTTTTTTTTTLEPSGGSLTAEIDASTGKPQTIEVTAGDQLALDVGVDSGLGRTIWIEDLGLTEFAAPDAPAHFDLLLPDPGKLAITDERGEVIGRIAVLPRGADPEDNSGP